MATRRSQIIASVLLTGQRAFRSGLQDLGLAARSFGRAVSGITGNGMGSGMRLTEMHSGFQMVGSAARSASGSVKAVFSAASDRDSMMRSLEATSDGVRSVESQFERLRTKAMDAGVSVDAMAQSFTQLRGAAVASEDAEKTASAVANALQRIGKGADFGAVMTNLVQITSRTTGLGDEIKETANYLPEIRKLSKMRFGTDTGEGLNQKNITGREWVAGITEELAKYEKATGGAKAATAGFANEWENFKTSVGQLIEKPATWAIMGASSLADKASGKIQERYPQEERMTESEQAAKREKAAKEFEALEERRMENVDELFRKEEDIAHAENILAKARAANDDDATMAAMQDIALLKEKLSIMALANATDEEATGHIRTRVALEHESEMIARNALRSKQQAKEGRDLAETEGEAGGMSSRRMKKLKKENRLMDERDRLMEDGHSPDQAKAMAERKISAEDRVAENADRADRGLRPRIRTATGDEARRNRFNRMASGDREKLGGLNHNESAEETFDRKEKGGIGAHSSDDPMAMRPRESRLRPRIQGVGSKHKDEARKGDDSPNAGGSIGQQMATLIQETRAVRDAIKGNSPSANDKSKPLSSTHRTTAR